jgi:hypothetical protein
MFVFLKLLSFILKKLKIFGSKTIPVRQNLTTYVLNVFLNILERLGTFLNALELL